METLGKNGPTKLAGALKMKEVKSILTTEDPEGGVGAKAPTSLDTNRTSARPLDIPELPERTGSAMFDQCEKASRIKLWKGGHAIVLPTTCKTWRCVPCQKRLMSLFKARVGIGCSTLGRCAFMTVTYKWAYERLNVAGYAQRDWKRLLRMCPQLQNPNQWLRVTEATKRGMPHHHLVVGPVHGRIRCYGDEFVMREFRRRFDTCDCLSHVVSRYWKEIVPDTEIVHAVPVTGEESAGKYLSKYMASTFTDRKVLERLGFKRRWSSSRGWPGGGRIRLAMSKGAGGPGWDMLIPGNWPVEQEGGDEDLLERSGELITLEKSAKRKERFMKKEAERYVDPDIR